MKLTKSTLQQMIKEEVDNILQEEESDCWRDYQNGSMTKEEYENCLKRFGGEDERTGGVEPQDDWEATKKRMKARRDIAAQDRAKGKYRKRRYY